MASSSETKKPHHQTRQSKRRILLWSLIVGGAFVILIGAVSAIAYAAPGRNIVRGVLVAGQPVGGLDTLTALHKMENKWQAFQERGIILRTAQRSEIIPIIDSSASDEQLNLALVDFSAIDSVNAALTFGRRGSWWQQLRERTSGWLGRTHEMGTVSVDDTELATVIEDKFHDLVLPAKNASLTFSASGTPTVVPSQDGHSFDFAGAVREAASQSRRLGASVITLKEVAVPATISTSGQLNTIAARDVPGVLDRAPLTLTLGDKTWTLTKRQVQNVLGFAGTTAAPRLGFDLAATATYLATIASDVNTKAQNAKFTVVDGRVKEFQASATGLTLDVASTTAAMQRDLIDGKQATTSLVMIEEKPLTDNVGANNLGITEQVAQATTNFKGSPTNRRFNLSYGAQLVNGLLIQPGEEFSLVKALGKIDGAHGWKPELVIKGPKITPEFGGGLCQVATTIFRTALNAGLPIVERHNHSLRISYYEPPVGLDATIYEPKPDLRFTNDYATPLLIQSEVKGNDITFTFYGTKDGRTVDIPEPKVYNKVPIPATKNIIVDDLKPGQQECQKPGHPGADATATYTVTKADGTKVTQTFQSHYKAIGVICRVGRSAAKPATTAPTTNTNTAPPVTDTNTSTDIVITNTNS